jgi:excisionase family DNA binding protein
VTPQAERDRLLGPDLAAVWNAPTTTTRDRKELLRTLIEDVTIKVDRDKAAAHLGLRWKGGALNEIEATLPRSRPATGRTDEDTIALLRRLAAHYPDGVIAGILNRPRHMVIASSFEPRACAPEGELLTIKKAAVVLGVAPSTIHRLLNDGTIAGEQPTPGAPWRIRLSKDLKDRFSGDAGEDFLPMREAMRALGVSRQAVLQRVKRGELAAVHVMRRQTKRPAYQSASSKVVGYA